jgi:hypothetical protein
VDSLDAGDAVAPGMHLGPVATQAAADRVDCAVARVETIVAGPAMPL